MGVGNDQPIDAPIEEGVDGGRRLGIIPANANLVMEVELVEVIKGEPIPDFRQLDAEKLQKKENGLKFEVLKEGEGESPKAGQCVKYKFVLWNGKGELVMCTQVSKMHIAGFMDKCNLPRLPDQFRPAFLSIPVLLTVWAYHGFVGNRDTMRLEVYRSYLEKRLNGLSAENTLISERLMERDQDEPINTVLYGIYVAIAVTA